VATTNDAVDEALSLPAGACWIRAALQVNPYGYKGAAAPSRSFTDEAAYNEALLARCRDLGIELIAVTDHWSVDHSQGLLTAATAAGVTALPGFEANTSEGVHLLVIFEQGTPVSTVNAAIGQCGADPGCPNGTTGRSFQDVLEAMTRRKALVIPAHVNVAARGLLHAVSGVPLQQMVVHPQLQALAVTPSQPETADQASVLAGRPPFARAHPLAVVHADDVCHPHHLDANGATTWFKVSAPSLASVRVAVRTSGTRVRVEPTSSSARTVLRALAWQGGFLDGVRLAISPELTAFIGGRGTGKSTVIETIRYLLDQAPLGTTAQREHQEFVREVLRPGTTCSLVVDVVRPAAGRYVIERTVPEPPLVRDASGTVTQLRPEDLVGVVEVFGQHELAELAQDKACVARMLERFAGQPVTDQERDRLRRDLVDNREQLARVENEVEQLDEALTDLPRLVSQVQQYRTSGLSERLEDQRLLDRDEAAFIEVAERVAAADQAAEQLVSNNLPQRISSIVTGISDSPRAASLSTLNEVLRRLADAVTASAAAVRAAAEQARVESDELHTSWTAETEPVRETHAAVLRELAEEGLDGDAYLKTVAALDALRRREQSRRELVGRLERLLADRQRLLGELTDMDAAAAERLRNAIRSANAGARGDVFVEPVAAPDRSAIKAVVNKHVRGQRSQIVAAVNSEDFSTRAFVAAGRESESALTDRYGVRGSQAIAVRNAGEVLFRELEEHSVGLAAQVNLDVGTAPRRRYKQLEDLSKGQRATALLLLLLGASTSPLVIDQPEDDLDQRFVFQGVVQQLRALKGTRQVLVSTHNANIPVLGDAELVVALEGDGDHGWPIEGGVGSLDEQSVRVLAEDLLEGGRAAFNERRYLYGF